MIDAKVVDSELPIAVRHAMMAAVMIVLMSAYSMAVAPLSSRTYAFR